MTNNYTNDLGATQKDLGQICVMQRQAAISNACALPKSSLTIEEHLAARPDSRNGVADGKAQYGVVLDSAVRPGHPGTGIAFDFSDLEIFLVAL